MIANRNNATPTTDATCISVNTPEGINAANVPPKISAADNTTPPI